MVLLSVCSAVDAVSARCRSLVEERDALRAAHAHTVAELEELKVRAERALAL